MSIKITADTYLHEFEASLKSEMEKPLDHFKKELLNKIRTGRANTAMIENIKVTCYGTEMPLKELASLTAPETRLLVIQSWDKSIINEIEKAILTSDLGLTPATEGDVIRIQLPLTTKERREELSKTLGKKLEECRVAIRNIRKDIQNLVRDAEKDHSISIDFSKRLLSILQDHTDNYIKKAEELAIKKEQEIKE